MRAKLEKIKIAGFKSFSVNEPQEVTFDEINVLIGANGAGKSNFVSFFKMLGKMADGALQIFVAQQGGANSLLHYGAKKTPRLEGTLFFQEGDDKERDYSFQLEYVSPDKLVFAKENTVFARKSQGFRQPTEHGAGHYESKMMSDYPENERIFIPLILLMQKCLFYQFHDTTEKSYIRNTSKIDDCYYLYSDGGNLAAYLLMLKTRHPKYYDRIVQWIRNAVPQFHDFVLEPSPYNENTVLLSWREKGNDYIFGPHQISDGSLRFMALATLLMQPPELLPNLLIIDEPELGLHPAAIGALAAMVRTASQHCQVILATQSPRLLDEFSPEEIIVAEWDKQKLCTRLKRLDEKELAEWLDDFALSDLWEKNVLGGLP